MVLTLMVPARKWLGLQELVTLNHLDNIAKIVLTTSWFVGYAYAMEVFVAWYSGVEYEKFCFMNRAFGPYWWAYWTMVSCNVFIPQLLWFRQMRRNAAVLWVVSVFINIGMWFERFVIIVTSLHRDFLPSSWGMFRPTIVDMLTLTGSFGFFLTFFLLFCRYLPILAISEVKGVMAVANPHHGARCATRARARARRARGGRDGRALRWQRPTTARTRCSRRRRPCSMRHRRSRRPGSRRPMPTRRSRCTGSTRRSSRDRATSAGSRPAAGCSASCSGS
jgi:hypothetical protein